MNCVEERWNRNNLEAVCVRKRNEDTGAGSGSRADISPIDTKDVAPPAALMSVNHKLQGAPTSEGFMQTWSSFALLIYLIKCNPRWQKRNFYCSHSTAGAAGEMQGQNWTELRDTTALGPFPSRNTTAAATQPWKIAADVEHWAGSTGDVWLCHCSAEWPRASHVPTHHCPALTSSIRLRAPHLSLQAKNNSSGLN